MKPIATLTKSETHRAYCSVCTACLVGSEKECDMCGTLKPAQGWTPLEGSPFPFLAKHLDNRYIFRQFLGEGATGYVYRAQALQIHRDFAAKIVDTRRYGREDFQQELLRRFDMEVEAMSRLRNPHVVAIYEAMRLKDHLFVLLMDYVDGRTLQKLLERVGRIKYQRALDIIRQIANGLYEAHTLGFIHRDVKPDNIMIERLPASGFFARILDFGIVHMMNDTAMTQGFRGTPLYASPEQCMGDAIDHRSDIYGLGCVFFHCLTGQPPFPGNESLKVMDAHVNLEPPSVYDVLENTRIPAGVNDLVTRMLAKNPDHRPESLSAVIEEIDKLLIASHQQLAEPTNPEPPLMENPLADIQLSRRLDTADFPAAPSLAEGSVAQIERVRSIIEFQLPTSQSASFSCVHLAADGELAMLADSAFNVHSIGMRNDGFLHTIKASDSTITAVALDPMRRNVYAADLNGQIVRWALGSNTPPQLVTKLTDRVYAMWVGLRAIVCGTDKGRLVAIDTESGKVRFALQDGRPVSSIRGNIHDNRVLVGFWDGSLALWNVSTDKLIELRTSGPPTRSIAFTDDLKVASTLAENGIIHFFDYTKTETDTLAFEVVADKPVRDIAFAKDNELLGMNLEERALALLDIKSAAILLQLGKE